jgi:hypothetical protein
MRFPDSPALVAAPSVMQRRTTVPHGDGVPMKSAQDRLGFAWAAYLSSPDAHCHRAHHRIRELVTKRLSG